MNEKIIDDLRNHIKRNERQNIRSGNIIDRYKANVIGKIGHFFIRKYLAFIGQEIFATAV